MTLEQAIRKVRFHAKWIYRDRELVEALTMVADAAEAGLRAPDVPSDTDAEDALHAHVRACPQCHRARHVAPHLPAVAIGRDRMCEQGRELSIAFVNSLWEVGV